MRQWKSVNQLWKMIEEKLTIPAQGNVYLGVDVGTANIVSVVVDEQGTPLAGRLTPARVAREGMIMDFLGAVDVVEQHITCLRKYYGEKLVVASSAVPPLTEVGNEKITRNVLEAAGLEVVEIIDEPTAAALALDITDGIVVDMGGGSTGISVLHGGNVVYTADEPTGGFQMDLVLAGHLRISVEEAERLKCDQFQQGKLFHVLKPVFEKVAAITNYHISEFSEIDSIYMVGGSSSFSGFAELMEAETGKRVVLPEHALLVTSLGIAISCALAAHDSK